MTPSLTWLVLHTEGKKNMQCYVVCCTVFTTPYIHDSAELHLFHIDAIFFQYRHDQFWWNISCLFFLRLHLYDIHSSQSSLLRDKGSETERRGWWKGCRGGRLTREERVTATIIKIVLLLRYLEASLPFQLLLSNISLVTSLHSRAPSLLTWQWHRQREEKKEDRVRTLNNSIRLIQFSWIHLFIFIRVRILIRGRW